MKYVSKGIKYLLYFIVIIFAVVSISAAYSYFFVETKNTHNEAPKETQFLAIGNSEEIAYQEISHNSDTTVVFVGGLSGWSGTWTRTLGELDVRQMGKYNLLVIDLPPFGFSTSNTNKDFLRSSQADRIAQFLQKKRIKKVIFVAHSYGAGPVTEAIMSDQSGFKVEKLIIIDGILNIDEVKNQPSFLVAAITQQHLLTYLIASATHYVILIQNRLRGFVYDTEHIGATLTKIYMQPFVISGNSNRLARWLDDYLRDPLVYASTKSASYSKLSMPVRIIWGDHDTLAPPALALNLASLVKDSKLYLLKNVGHIPMIEDYAQFDKALFQALSE